MKKNISLLTFSVQNVNSSYSEPHSSFNANSESLKVDQESFTWIIIFCFLITRFLDNVLALDLDHSQDIKKILSKPKKTILILFIIWLTP